MVVLLDEQKLASSDSQVAVRKEIAKRLHEKNADFYRVPNFVRMAMRAPGGGRPSGDRGVPGRLLTRRGRA